MNIPDNKINNSNNIKKLNPDIITQLDESNQKLCNVLVDSEILNEEQIKKLIQIEEQNKNIGIDVDIRELIVNQGYINRSQLIFYLRKAGLKNRLGEILSINSKLTDKQLGDVIITQIFAKQIGNNKTFGEIIIEKGYMEKFELITFMKKNGLKLTQNELEYLEAEEKKQLILSEGNDEPEIIEIEIGPLEERTEVNKNNGKAVFNGTDLQTFEEIAEKKNKINENREYTLDEIASKNKHTSNYYPKNYKG